MPVTVELMTRARPTPPMAIGVYAEAVGAVAVVVLNVPLC